MQLTRSSAWGRRRHRTTWLLWGGMAVDGASFDRFSRAVARTGSRRVLLRWAAGALAAWVPAVGGAAQAECQPGTYVNGTTCSPCPVGTYSDTANSANCSSCPLGTYANTTGNS